MATKKKPSEMTLDELYAEERVLNSTFFSTRNLIGSLSIVALTIVLALYIMKDSFSYFFAALILWLLYSVASKFIYRSKLVKEIKSRQ
ncbi:hypothetical protein F5984_20265 [Rudanella paleaurantiibacter]|uniref:FUSC family protein n=1 Tax=Rudanella paleaurantiibacter TaxID=2614655 RepID=A0A7J5TVI2_9BACT|nr:hypothetical protein [Rudanella paleaurantiibacter]KAB7728087.1 hypothetical protein F5984_20265 [Rudanella paleaurantiibacter]